MLELTGAHVTPVVLMLLAGMAWWLPGVAPWVPSVRLFIVAMTTQPLRLPRRSSTVSCWIAPSVVWSAPVSVFAVMVTLLPASLNCNVSPLTVRLIVCSNEQPLAVALPVAGFASGPPVIAPPGSFERIMNWYAGSSPARLRSRLWSRSSC